MAKNTFKFKSIEKLAKPAKNVILKMYLKNITVEKDEIAIIKCPSVFVSQKNKESQMNEYFQIKTVSLKKNRCNNLFLF